jgi:hypothetical protein
MTSSRHRPKKGERLYDSADVADDFAAFEMWRTLEPPVFYRNQVGVVTNRRQHREYYEKQLIRPRGPYVWARR